MPLDPHRTVDDGVDDVFTVDEGAKFLKVGRNTLYEAIARGEVPHRRIGKNIRLSRSGLMRWLASCGQTQVAKKGQ